MYQQLSAGNSFKLSQLSNPQKSRQRRGPNLSMFTPEAKVHPSNANKAEHVMIVVWNFTHILNIIREKKWNKRTHSFLETFDPKDTRLGQFLKNVTTIIFILLFFIFKMSPSF